MIRWVSGCDSRFSAGIWSASSGTISRVAAKNSLPFCSVSSTGVPPLRVRELVPNLLEFEQWGAKVCRHETKRFGEREPGAESHVRELTAAGVVERISERVLDDREADDDEPETVGVPFIAEGVTDATFSHLLGRLALIARVLSFRSLEECWRREPIGSQRRGCFSFRDARSLAVSPWRETTVSADGREVMGATEGLAVQWGVRPSSALWPVTMRILFVLDGRIDTSHGSGCFGLGYVVDTLRDPSFSWWVRLRVDVVRRDRGELRLCSQGDVNSLAPGDQVEFDVLDFKFTEPKFSLDDYDQVWFFGDYPANSEQPIDDPSFRPLCDDELRLLAEWMDRGGGVFAAGDHFNLGASMCSRVPRVRTMRRWTQAQGVPPMDGEYRHETLQHVAGGYDDVWEGDTTPQTIEPVLQAQFSSIVSAAGPFIRCCARPTASSTLGTAEAVVSAVPLPTANPSCRRVRANDKSDPALATGRVEQDGLPSDSSAEAVRHRWRLRRRRRRHRPRRR